MRNLPTDWDHNPLPRGVHRDVSHRRYVVTSSIQGVRRYLGSAQSQHDASRLYDAALYKLAAKVSGPLVPNHPDTFATEATHAGLTDRLHALYLKLPYLRPDDAMLTEAELRAERLASPEPVASDVRKTTVLRCMAHQVAALEVGQRRIEWMLKKFPLLLPDERDALTDLRLRSLSLQRDFQATADFFGV